MKRSVEERIGKLIYQDIGWNVAILHEEVEKWNDTVNKMRKDYEETIHSLIPENFEKKWVKNLEKKGKLVWWKWFSLLTLGASLNLFVFIDTSGGYMEWNINPDQLILAWLVNLTPPSCIRVNILLMEMITNPTSKVAKMIPCIKYTRNMRSTFTCSPSSF